MVFAKFVRRFLAARRVAKELRKRLRPFSLTIKSVNGLMASPGQSKSDPYVIVTAREVASPTPFQLREPGASATDASMQQTTRYQTAVIRNTLDAEFNDTINLSGCSGSALLVFTVLDKDFIQVRAMCSV